MNFLDKKVEEILKNHPSGEDFFNHLDDMICGHKSIIDAAWDKLVQWCYDEHLWVNRGIPTFGWNGLILTGAFGRAVFNYMPYEIRKTFEQVILVNGGDCDKKILKHKYQLIKQTLMILSYLMTLFIQVLLEIKQRKPSKKFVKVVKSFRLCVFMMVVKTLM